MLYVVNCKIIHYSVSFVRFGKIPQLFNHQVPCVGNKIIKVVFGVARCINPWQNFDGHFSRVENPLLHIQKVIFGKDNWLYGQVAIHSDVESTLLEGQHGQSLG